jgi:hypothetical protein
MTNLRSMNIDVSNVKPEFEFSASNTIGILPRVLTD